MAASWCSVEGLCGVKTITDHDELIIGSVTLGTSAWCSVHLRFVVV